MIDDPFLIQAREIAQIDMSVPVKTSTSEITPSDFQYWFDQPIVANSERSATYLSLIHMARNKRPFSESLEDKAVSFLEEITPESANDVDSFILDLDPSSLQESSHIFVETVVVLISVRNRRIKQATFDFVDDMVHHSPVEVRLKFIQNDLVPKVISSLDFFSPRFSQFTDDHTTLLKFLNQWIRSSTEITFKTLTTTRPDEQQTLAETLFRHVLMPMEGVVQYLCEHRFSIVDSILSTYFLQNLCRIQAISTLLQQESNLVLNPLIVLTIPCVVALFEDDLTILLYLCEMIIIHLERKIINRERDERWIMILRQLRTEGFEDIVEQRLKNDIGGSYRGKIVTAGIQWNNLMGMNLSMLK
ncbi:hypothetical protein BLNAU_14259 [Blattamonas nauphoetae]|uniref:Uncharacterized protein n=1 Tax=Blattamonas nauphoetae TaxID=2049346 RepID=A0ABQ9XEE5_9EUKA|nr:hypothetical protein BLNAU_14259 [Blattamonas nauphoetae]